MNSVQQSTNIHETIGDLITRDKAFAVAVVLKAEGSTPGKFGWKAVVESDGRIWGTLGGGAAEAGVQRRAVEAIAASRAGVFDFAFHGESVQGGIPICGGAMRILVAPVAVETRAVYVEAGLACRRRQRGVLLTAVHHAPTLRVEMRWFTKEAIPTGPEFPGAENIRSCLAREMPRVFVREASPGEVPVEVLVEPLIPPPRLLIVGGGHVGQAVARQASLLGFDITVIDDRPEFTRSDLYPTEATVRCGDFAREVAAFPTDSDTYVVLVTRGPQHDAAALAACLLKPAAYIGMIGSRRKVALMRQDFLASGAVTAEAFDGVFAPIGLDIGAVTPAEIAASILAEVIAVRRKADGAFLPLRRSVG